MQLQLWVLEKELPLVGGCEQCQKLGVVVGGVWDELVVIAVVWNRNWRLDEGCSFPSWSRNG